MVSAGPAAHTSWGPLPHTAEREFRVPPLTSAQEEPVQDGTLGSNGPRVVGPAPPHATQPGRRTRHDLRPGGAGPVQDETIVSDGPEIIGPAPPHVIQASERANFGYRPGGAIKVHDK